MSEPDEKAREALEHLQKAALEMIAAARSVLDLMEEAVKDPTPFLAAAAATAEAAADASARLRSNGGADAHPHESRVEHIRVS